MHLNRSRTGFVPTPELFDPLDVHLRYREETAVEFAHEPEILIVMEDFLFSRAIGTILQDQGYQVFLAPDVITAIEEMANYNFDLVIVQLRRGKFAGLEAAKKAKEAGRSKVLVLSGPQEMVFPAEAFQMEVDDYLVFPFSMAELSRRVAACLGPASAGVIQTERKSQAELINERFLESLHLLFGEIKSSLGSVSTSLNLINRARYGKVEREVTEKLHEVGEQVSHIIRLANIFNNRTSQIKPQI